MDGPSAILFGVLIPAVVAGIVLLVSARRARAESARADSNSAESPSSIRARPRPIAGALALGAAYLAAHTGLKAVPAFPWSDVQLDSTAKLYWMVAAAIVLSPLRVIPYVRRYGNSLYVAGLAILPYHFIRAADAPREVFDLAGLATVLLVYAIWMSLERLALRRPGPSLPIALWGACAGTALVAVLNKSAIQAQLLGALAAGLGAAVVVAILVRGAHLATGVIAILALAVAAIVRISVIYDLPTISWALVALAFVGPWAGEIPALRARSPFLAGAVAFLAALVPAAAAAWFAHAARPVYAY